MYLFNLRIANHILIKIYIKIFYNVQAPNAMGEMAEGSGAGREEEDKKGSGDVPSHMQDFMARSYASWLMWWRNTINSDDYMKYLSTQVSHSHQLPSMS